MSTVIVWVSAVLCVGHGFLCGLPCLASCSVGFPLLAAMVLALLPCDGCHCVVCSCVGCSCAGFVIRLCVFFMLAVVVLDLVLALVFSLCWSEL